MKTQCEHCGNNTETPKTEWCNWFGCDKLNKTWKNYAMNF